MYIRKLKKKIKKYHNGIGAPSTKNNSEGL